MWEWSSAGSVGRVLWVLCADQAHWAIPSSVTCSKQLTGPGFSWRPLLSLLCRFSFKRRGSLGAEVSTASLRSHSTSSMITMVGRRVVLLAGSTNLLKGGNLRPNHKKGSKEKDQKRRSWRVWGAGWREVKFSLEIKQHY